MRMEMRCGNLDGGGLKEGNCMKSLPVSAVPWSSCPGSHHLLVLSLESGANAARRPAAICQWGPSFPKLREQGRNFPALALEASPSLGRQAPGVTSCEVCQGSKSINFSLQHCHSLEYLPR